MTETYILLNKGKIDKDNPHEGNYVTYTTPSRQDKDWELVWYAHQYPHRDRPTHYFRCYKFIDDEVAQREYPIFRKLATARNWAPMDEIPPLPGDSCPHASTSLIGHSAITRKPVFRCNNPKCGALVLHDRMPITSGKYDIFPEEYVRISQEHCSHRDFPTKRLGETQIEGVFYPVSLCSGCDRVFLGATQGEARHASRQAKVEAVRKLNHWHEMGRL